MRGRAEAIAIAVVGCALAALVAAGPASGASSTLCPGTFTVLHNDRVGALELPAARYEITVQTPVNLDCRTASRLFADFLRRPSGNLPDGWRVNANRARFANRATNQAFSVRRARADGGGGGGGGGTGGGGTGGGGRRACPTFEVLHNDRIGSLRIPAGDYVITVKRMSCPRASAKFRRFLQRPDGRLGGGWQLKPRKAKFRNPRTGESFRIKRA